MIGFFLAYAFIIFRFNDGFLYLDYDDGGLYFSLGISSIQVHGLWKKFKVQEQGLSTTLYAENLLAEITRVYRNKLMFILLSHYELTKRDADNLDERSCVLLIRIIMIYKDYYECINGGSPT
ncbi:unnamed protein product [Rhizophagus irregularis]|nr:unnamed protein product [Rhizophagus irregularis]CAB5103557.1 unnamed protein product [Rhizophagus irregularis]